jgi:ABC-type sulfate/molybdate transport systems ATPase subunit
LSFNTAAPDPRRIFIFQENGVFPWLTVAENIGFGLGGNHEAERQEIVARYIELMGHSGFEVSFSSRSHPTKASIIDGARGYGIRRSDQNSASVRD